MPFFNSYNPSAYGWSPDSSQIVSFDYHGASFPGGVHRLAVPIFTGLLNDLVAAGLRVPPGNSSVVGNWGYEARNIRGASDLSFHAFGLAIDVDAPHNGMTYSHPPATTFPSSTPEIAKRWGCEWGGSWSGRADPMHLELHLAPSEIASWLKNLGGSAAATGTSTARPTLHTGSTGKDVGWLQKRLNLVPARTPTFGPITAEAVRMYQGRHRLTVDGICGPATWSALLAGNVLPGERTVQRGCTGDDVGWLQRRLGLTPAPHPAYGPITERAVTAWKGKRALGGGGTVGPVTWRALGADG